MLAARQQHVDLAEYYGDGISISHAIWHSQELRCVLTDQYPWDVVSGEWHVLTYDDETGLAQVENVRENVTRTVRCQR